LCELAGAEVNHTHFGRSLVPLLEDGSRPHRGEVFCEGGFRVADEHLFESGPWIYEPKGRLQHERPDLVGIAMCIRTDEWSYVYRRYESDELYDRRVDPYETVNRIGEQPEVEVDLRARLLSWLSETSDVTGWDPDPRKPDIPHGWR
jgi:hypothetical protein